MLELPVMSYGVKALVPLQLPATERIASRITSTTTVAAVTLGAWSTACDLIFAFMRPSQHSSNDQCLLWAKGGSRAPPVSLESRATWGV